MKTRLIKLTDTHYIVVDDSEIEEGDLVLNPLNEIQTYFKDYNFVESKKITHSTQPLEEVKLLSLSEVEEAINGYSVITLANEHQKIELELGKTLEGAVCSKYGFMTGYNKSQETHPFSEEDMVEFQEWCDTSEEAAIFWRRNRVDPDMSGSHNDKIKENIKKLLQLWKEQQPKIVWYE